MSLYKHFHSLYPSSDSSIDTKALANYYGISVNKVRKILKDNNIQKTSHFNTKYFWTPMKYFKDEIDRLDEIFKSELSK
jgi:Ca2+-binding EF-hand superfamily protein